jgi:Spy/CpxP family protein refolding chaperone
MNNVRSGRIIFYAALIFLAGFVTGALLAPILGRPFMRPPAPHEMSQHMLAHLQSILQLTDQQRAQIKPLVEKTGADMETIHRETMHRVLARLAETHAQISALLTPEQKIKFKEMEAEHRERLRHVHPLLLPPGPQSPAPDEK